MQDPAHYGEPVLKTPWVISDSYSGWSWHGFEGKPVVVELYAPGTEVELFQNGISLGRRSAGASVGFITRFETTYRPGTLLAVAYDGSTELGRMELSSAGQVSAVTLEPEESQGELVYVNILLRDEKGLAVTDRDTELTVQVSGGALAGLGSGDPRSAYNYNGCVTRTFHGRALAILRRGHGETSISVTTADGLTRSLTI